MVAVLAQAGRVVRQMQVAASRSELRVSVRMVAGVTHELGSVLSEVVVAA